MKILIFSLLFGLALCMPRLNQNQGDEDYVAPPHSSVYGQAKQYKKGQNGVGLSGSSRSRGSSVGGMRSSSCSLNCMRQMKSAIENDPEFSSFIEQQSKPTRFNSQFDVRMLNKYCQKMNETVECVAPCTDTQLKDMANKALSLPRYMCVETKFTTYAPCYNRVGKAMEKICHAENKCGPKKEALERDLAGQPTRLADIENMLGNTCDYMVCYSDCDREKVVQECGTDANRVLEGLYKKSIGVMEEIFRALSIQIEMPASCGRVGSGFDEIGPTDGDTDDDENDGSRATGRGGRGQGQGSRSRAGQGQSGGSASGQRGRTTTAQAPDDNEYIDEE